MNTNTIPEAIQPGAKAERFLAIAERGAIDEEARTVELAFATETPVERFWGFEVLDCQSRSIRQDRLRNGAALLVNHDGDDQVGVIESVQIGTDRVARAVVRFGKSARASEVFQDVVDGIRKNVSVGYRIHAAQLESESDGVATYRVTDWEPYEISLASVPADPNSGVGRTADTDPEPTPRHIIMDPNKNTDPAADPAKLDAARSAGMESERKRVSDISGMARTYSKYKGMDDLARSAITEGFSVDEFRAKAMDIMATQPLPTADLGLNKEERKSYSLVRALHYQLNKDDKRAREDAKFEIECSMAAAEKLGRAARGMVVPHDVLAMRADDLTAGTPAAGGDTVATKLLESSFIDLLRNRMVLPGMGMQLLTGLVGNIAIPRQTGGATAYWLAESGTVTDSAQAFDQVPMSPKTVAGKTQISRKLLMQSSLDVEAFVRNDLATVVGLALQSAAILGGGANEPTGILGTAGIGDVADAGGNGSAPSWGDIVDLESKVAIANADMGSLGYLTNAAVRGKLKQTEKVSGYPQYVWGDSSTPLNGYKAGVTNAVPSNLTAGTGTNLSAIIYGNFADLIMGMWGGLEIQVDPYSSGDSGSIIVRVFQDVDIAVRHALSFSAKKDAITA